MANYRPSSDYNLQQLSFNFKHSQNFYLPVRWLEKMKKLFPPMVVKNRDESHARIAKKNHQL